MIITDSHYTEGRTYPARRHTKPLVGPMTFILCGLIMFTSLRMKADDSATYAERLGWPRGTKAVIFHVDDVGMSHDSNMGAIKAVDKGVATSFSIMLPCPWVPEIAAWLEKNPDSDAGVHLTLNAEWKKYRWPPVAGPDKVPGLVDRQGCLWHGIPSVLSNATPDEVETEIRAQIDKALAMGIKPTHLDSHMGTVFLPTYFERYVKVGIEKKIPILIFDGHLQHIGKDAAPFKLLLKMMAQAAWNAGLPVIDDLVTDPTHAREYDKQKAELIALLKNMKPGITQIILHCTDTTETFSHISGSGPARRDEMRLMLDPDVRRFIESENIVLTTWRELHQRRKQISKTDP